MKLKGIERKRYDNGLTLLLEHLPEKKKAALVIGVKVGSVNENPELSGASHFNEHMLFKSNKYLSYKEIIRSLEYAGIITNAYTTYQYTAFYAKSPPREIEKAIQILFQAATNFSYEEKEFSLEKEVILAEIHNYINSPEDYVMSELFVPTLFRGTPLSNKILGTIESIKNIKKETLENFKAEYYTPGNMIIAVSGNFDIETVEKKIEETFASLEKRKSPNTNVKIDKRNEYYRKIETRKDITQTYLCSGYRVDGYESDDMHKIEFLSSLLSEGMSSRLFIELREKRGIGYSVGNIYYPLENVGIFCTHVDGFDTSRLKETENVINDIYQNLKKYGTKAKELEGMKNLFLSKYEDKLENVVNRGIMLIEREIYSIKFDFREKEKYIKEINNEDVMEIAEKIFTEDYTITLLMPEKS